MLYNRKQLAELLNTSTNSIRKMEKRNTLNKKLNTLGYKLINISKGNKTTYNIVENDNPGIKALSTLNIRKPYNFTKYLNDRLQNKAISIKDIAINSCVNKNTVVNTEFGLNTRQLNKNKKLIDNKVMARDGFYYFKLTLGDNEAVEVSKEEYNSFWRNMSYIKALKQLQKRYLNGDITLNELQLATADISSYYSIINGVYCFRVNKFKVDKENDLYLDLSKLLN